MVPKIVARKTIGCGKDCVAITIEGIAVTTTKRAIVGFIIAAKERNNDVFTTDSLTVLDLACNDDSIYLVAIIYQRGVIPIQIGKNTQRKNNAGNINIQKAMNNQPSPCFLESTSTFELFNADLLTS